MRLGIIGCADIAFKRFMPAIREKTDVQVVAVAEEYDTGRLKRFWEKYQIEGMNDYKRLIHRDDIDAIYVPQPPALHFKWAEMGLNNNKHVFLEKPSTTSALLSESLVQLARKNSLALHENYMFQYHSQIGKILEMIQNGEIGQVRLYRISFGFPLREKNDFRYNKEAGGGALLDAGGYTLKLADLLLGRSTKIDAASLSYIDNFEVDMYGSGQLSNSHGVICQVSFGMDCAYKCSLEVWGSKGTLYTNRIFTAPDGYQPMVSIEDANGKREIKMEADSHFGKSVEHFLRETRDEDFREAMYEEIVGQARLVDSFKILAQKGCENG